MHDYILDMPCLYQIGWPCDYDNLSPLIFLWRQSLLGVCIHYLFLFSCCDTKYNKYKLFGTLHKFLTYYKS